MSGDFVWHIDLVLAICLAGISLLTTFRVRTWVDWPTKIILGMLPVGECGIWLAMLPLGAGIVGHILSPGHWGVAAVTIALCLLAITLFLKPTVQAMRIGRTLPAKLEAAFGKVDLGWRPFSIGRMFGASPRTVECKTLEYSPSMMLDFYPAMGRALSPCVIILHGGAWRVGNRRGTPATRATNSLLARAGYAVASIDYRLAPKSTWPAQRDDLLAAITYLRNSSSELGIDPTRIVLMGRSAGGQIAEATAYANPELGICGVIGFYAPSDLKRQWQAAADLETRWQRPILEQFLGGTPETVGENYVSASPIGFVGDKTPPTLLFHGRIDSIISHDHSQLLADELAKNGVKQAFVSLPWGTHGFDYVSTASPGGQLATFAVHWFLQAVTR